MSHATFLLELGRSSRYFKVGCLVWRRKIERKQIKKEKAWSQPYQRERDMGYLFRIWVADARREQPSTAHTVGKIAGIHYTICLIICLVFSWIV